jgi:SAM-dependent methyltransferase
MMALQDFFLRIRDAWSWRVSPLLERLSRRFGKYEVWPRVIMNRQIAELVKPLPVAEMSALEIGGTNWQQTSFASYRSVDYPEYDVCKGPLAEAAFDFVIAEQVLEHLLWPYRAVRHVWQMLRPGGYFLVSTPFLIKVHEFPVDCSRWTETGLKHLLAEGGFPLDGIVTGSWGNRACVKTGLSRVPHWIPWWHSLRNEPKLPVMVWALARKTAISGPAAKRP